MSMRLVPKNTRKRMLDAIRLNTKRIAASAIPEATIRQYKR
jgi:hypothetical protein